MDFREPVNPEARSFEEEGGRELVVEQDVVSPRMTSTSYLARKLHLEALANPKPIPMCGRPGVMVILQGVDGDEDGTSVIAGVVLPDGAAITLLLRVPRSLTAGDAALAETIASTITYQPTNNQPDRDPDAIQKPEDPGNPQDTE
jgi:hypothetical protein